LLDDKYEPKPAFEVLKNLFFTKWHTETSGTLPADGSTSQRAFYGDYEITLNLPSAQTAHAAFSFPEGRPAQIRLKLNSQTGAIERI
jgi:hypothetical protein